MLSGKDFYFLFIFFLKKRKNNADDCRLELEDQRNRCELSCKDFERVRHKSCPLGVLVGPQNTSARQKLLAFVLFRVYIHTYLDQVLVHISPN